MGMKFVGGPYDGQDLDYEQVVRHADLVTVSGDVGTRQFVRMPDRASWEARLRGETVGKGPQVVYERTVGPDESHWKWISDRAFDQAQREGRVKLPLGGRSAWLFLDPRDRRAVLRKLAPLVDREPASWPQARFTSRTEDEALYAYQVPPDWLVFVKPLEGGGVELFDIMTEGTMEKYLQHAHAENTVE